MKILLVVVFVILAYILFCFSMSPAAAEIVF